MDEYMYWFKLIIILIAKCDKIKELFKKSIKIIKNNKFINSLLILFKNYENDMFLNKTSYKLLLFRYIEIYHNKNSLKNITIEIIKNKKNIEFINILFFIDILKTFGICFKDLYYYDNFLYTLVLQNRTDIFTNARLENDSFLFRYVKNETPEILILFNQELFRDFNEYPLYYSIEQQRYISLKQTTLQEKTTISSTTGIPTYEEEINYNGNNYKLEACLLDNFIIGLTSDDDCYIYDGCNEYIYDWKKALRSSQETFNIKSENCKLHQIYKDEIRDINFGYDIRTGKRNNNIILIYIKINQEEIKTKEQKEQEELSNKSLDYSSSSIQKYLKNYYEIDDDSFDKLKKVLIKIGYKLLDISQFTKENILTKLENKYKVLFKIRELDDDTIIKYFMKQLIINYLKNKKIYSFIDLFKLDDTIIKEIDSIYVISNLNKEDLIKLYSYLYKTESIDTTFNNKFFIDKIKEKLFKLSPCHNLEVIPQVSGTCWFNVILMALLYSQETRRITYELSLEWTREEIKEDKIKNFFTYMLKYNYTEPEKITKLFEGKTKPELLLMSLLIKNNQNYTIDYFRRNLKTNIYGFHFGIYWITNFLSLYNYKFLSLFYINRAIYDNILYDKLRIKKDEIPEIIVLFNEKIFTLNEIKIDKYRIKYKKETKGVIDYKEIIEVNKINYKLDSCLLSSYNNLPSGYHIILGLTCGNENYVYNGWNKTKHRKKYGYEYSKTINKACKLFKYDWKRNLYKENDGFCLNKKTCNLDEIDDNDLCFNFSKGDRVLIYVRIKEDESPKLLETKEEISMSYNSKSISPLIKEFYDLEEKEIEELKELLKQIGYNITIIEELTNETIHLKYKLFYIYLFNKLLKKEDDVLKDFLIKLIKDYIKNYKIYNLDIFTNDEQIIVAFLLNIEEEKLLNIYKIITEGKELVTELPIDYEYKRVFKLKNFSIEKQLMIYNILIKKDENILGGNKKRKLMKKYN